MGRVVLLSLLIALSACGNNRHQAGIDGCLMHGGPGCPEALSTKGPHGYVVQNNDGKVWQGVRDLQHGFADATRPIRRETAKFLVPEDILTNEADYVRYIKRESEQPPQPTYCYKTMADVNCYYTPLPGEESRLVQ